MSNNSHFYCLLESLIAHLETLLFSILEASKFNLNIPLIGEIQRIYFSTNQGTLRHSV